MLTATIRCLYQYQEYYPKSLCIWKTGKCDSNTRQKAIHGHPGIIRRQEFESSYYNYARKICSFLGKYELPDVQAGFRKGRGTRDQIANICWIIEKAREFQKNIYFCFIDYPKAFDCVDHNKLWKILKRWEYQTTWPASWEICMQVKKQQLKWDMELRLVPHQERSTSRLYIVTLLI